MICLFWSILRWDLYALQKVFLFRLYFIFILILHIYLWDWNNYISVCKDNAKTTSMNSVRIYITCISFFMNVYKFLSGAFLHSKYWTYFFTLSYTIQLILCMLSIFIYSNENKNGMGFKIYLWSCMDYEYVLLNLVNTFSNSSLPITYLKKFPLLLFFPQVPFDCLKRKRSY